MKNSASSKIQLQRIRQTKLKVGYLNIALISSQEKNGHQVHPICTLLIMPCEVFWKKRHAQNHTGILKV
jgi:hypothetical protein